MIGLLSACAAVLALIGLPLFLVIFAMTLLGQRAVGLQAPVIFVEIFDKITDNPVFMTIPLFAHAGFVLSESRAPERLVNLSRAALGWLPGGSSLVTIVVCALFTAFTGASGVTIIALGGLLLPVLVKESYPERFNLGLLTTCGSLGLLFPPSLPLIIYALIASNIAPVAVDTLFLAGVIPGLLLMVALALYGGFICSHHACRVKTPFQIDRLLRAFGAAIFELPIPIIIIGGIFGGYLTLAQAAAVVAIYVSFVEVVIYRDLTCRELAKATVNSMVLVGGILVIIMAALAMTNFLTDQEIPRRILAAMRTHIQSPLSFLLVLNLFLLVVGCLMDIYSAILVVVPLVLPIALDFGVDPVHLGIIFLANLEIGYSTPPVGINLFIASLRFGKPVVSLYQASIPFIGLLLVCLGLITYLPQLSLTLVRAVEGTGTVELRWVERPAAAAATGSGSLKWARRTPGVETDPDAFLEPGDAASRHDFTDLALRYRPSGEQDVVVFELDDGTGAVRAAWRSPAGAWDAPAGDLEELGLRPPESPLRTLPLTEENWTSALEVLSVEDGRVQGRLRAIVLWFPEDETLPEEIYDLVLDFSCPAVLDDPSPRPIPPGGASRRIHDVRLLERTLADGGKSYALERTRSRPWNLSASWTAALADSAADLSSFKLEMWDVPEELLPLRSGQLWGGRVQLEPATAAGERLRGRLQAVLQSSTPSRTFDLEIAFDTKIDVPVRSPAAAQ